MKRFACALAVSSLALTGCVTKLETTPEPGLSQRTRGIPYRLPETRIELAASWSVVGCSKLTYTYLKPDTAQAEDQARQKAKAAGASDAEQDAAADEAKQAVIDGTEATIAEIEGLAPQKAKQFLRKVEGNIEATGDRTLGAGWPTVGELKAFSLVKLKPTATYSAKTIEGPTLILDYEELTRMFKTGSLTVEYHKGTQLLKSINAKVDGQEVAALKAATGIFSSVARIGLGLPAVGGSGSADVKAVGDPIDVTAQHCTTNGIDLVNDRNKVLSDIKAEETTLAAISAKIGQINVKIAKGGMDEAALTKLKKELADESSKLKTSTTAVAALKAKLAIYDKYLTMTKKVQLTGTGKPVPAQIVLDKEQVYKLENTVIDLNVFEAEELVKGAALNIAFAPVRGSTESCADSSNSAEEGCRLNTPEEGAHSGLVYRTPVPSKLEVTTPNAVDPKERTVLKAEIKVAQFGRVRELPLRNAFGESNSLEALFDEQGIPSKIAYTKTKSGSLETLSALADAAKTIDTLREQIEADKKAKEDAATAEIEALAAKELTDLQRKRDLLKTQDEIDALENTETPDPTQLETLEAEFKILDLTLKISETQKALEAVLTPETPDPTPLEALKAENEILEELIRNRTLLRDLDAQGDGSN